MALGNPPIGLAAGARCGRDDPWSTRAPATARRTAVATAWHGRKAIGGLPSAIVVALGGVALLLAAIGIHGLVASSVSERTRELGIRLALGATAGQVMRGIVVPGLLLAGVGVVIGAAMAVVVGRLLQSFLWGVTPADPITFATVIATLMAVTLGATVIPALAVLRLDPATTLRAE